MNFNNITFYTSYGLSHQAPPSKCGEVVFSGRSNVGKSSLINKIANQKHLARTSSQPGKTITINFYTAAPGYLVDLPGYGFAKVSKSERDRWGKLMDDYFTTQRDIRLVVQLIDSRHAPSKDDVNMVNFLSDSQLPFLVALTKYDKLNATQKRECMEKFYQALPCGDQITYIPVSTVTGEGIEQLRATIAECMEESI